MVELLELAREIPSFEKYRPATRRGGELFRPSLGAGDRASSRADKLRKRLGWEAGILNGDGGKPKGMHWKTYQRIKSQHDALVQVSFHDIGRKLGFLHKLLDG